MVLSCFVVDCTKNAAKSVETSFHKIPDIIKETNKKYARSGGLYTLKEIIQLSKRRQEEWISATKRGPLSESQLRNAKIYSNHFISGRPADITDVHNLDWIPCRNLGYNVGFALKRPSALERHKRYIKREKLTESRNDAENFDPNIQSIDDDWLEAETGTSSQTDILGEELSRLFDKLRLSESEVEKIEKRFSKSELTEVSFRNDDSKTLYLTGLNTSMVLFTVHDIVAPHLFIRGNTVLTTFQQLLLTLVKLRLNLPFKYLSYRFDVGANTAFRYFHRCLHILYCTLNNIIHRPDRETLHATMPE